MPKALAPTIALCVLVTIGDQWTPQTSGVTARLRGVSAASDRVVWASGANGTILRTVDGGRTWQRQSIPGTEKLDFRDIDAIGEQVAYVMSIGPGDASRIYKTVDGGDHWTKVFMGANPKAFYDAMAFWDADHGVAIADSIDGRFAILTTANGGALWTEVDPASLPPALPNEGAFAASGTNVAVLPPHHVWIGTGAASRARVLRSADGGKTWQMADTPLASGESAGIFSVAFRDPLHGIVVGGDYRREGDAVKNAAITTDGGATWTASEGLGGFRSVAAYVPDARRTALVAIGPSGSDLSTDDGRSWTPIPGDGFHAFSFAPRTAVGWGVGEGGKIGVLLTRGQEIKR
jgi:photosystem II stability/assembly factor-like uncharacterized protein